MRYHDEAECCGCMCHRTIGHNDCHHELMCTSRCHSSHLHSQWSLVQVMGVGGGTMWVSMGIIAIWEACGGALGPAVHTE